MTTAIAVILLCVMIVITTGVAYYGGRLAISIVLYEIKRKAGK